MNYWLQKIQTDEWIRRHVEEAVCQQVVDLTIERVLEEGTRLVNDLAFKFEIENDLG